MKSGWQTFQRTFRRKLVLVPYRGCAGHQLSWWSWLQCGWWTIRCVL